VIKNLPWEWIQSFAVVAKLGSLSKAAVALNTSQPTLSRHMAGLEKEIGTTLFDRSTQGLKLTSSGEKLVEYGESMQQAAEQFTRIASGTVMSLAGNIRISANEVVGLYYLPAVIAKFKQKYPEVSVEIDVSNKTTSINQRDTDIALRMFRPTQPDLVVKRLPDIKLRAVASKEYLAEYSEPKSLQELSDHRLIGFDRDLQFIKTIKALGWPLFENEFTSKTDFLPLQIELARKGLGVTVTHEYLLKEFTELQAILPDLTLPNLEFWLVCHADVQHNRRIRVMMDFLAEHLEAKLTFP